QSAEAAEDRSPNAVPDSVPDEVPGPAPGQAPNLTLVDASIPDAVPDAVPAADTAPAADEAPSGWFARLRSGLSRTSSQLSDGLTGIFTRRKLDDETLEELEDILIQADLGVAVASRITEALAADRYDKEISPQEVREVLAAEVSRTLTPVAHPLEVTERDGPTVILMVGVNGTGKTTTIGKLAHRFRAEGKSVMLAAGDTFRAAAVEQLKVWGERTGAPVITREAGADAAGLAYDAISDAKATDTDVLLIDTAGRLQNKEGLMSELEKIRRVIAKHDGDAPHHVILVLDGTTGQNALSQVELFGKTAGVTGLVMTKLDGTARGGILVAIAEKFALPIHAVGVGEAIDDLRPFSPDEFAAALVAQDTAPPTPS
ncbi:MAG: signal recognition particle-docking protein FtsY, partial [Pseudomonadota bacterium]